MTEAIPDLKYWCKGEPSECGKRVARLLAEWVGGAHHLPQEAMKKVDWQNQRYVVVKADSSLTGGGLSTFDFTDLTRLVFLAHDHCIRVDIRPLNPQLLALTLHPRNSRDGGMTARHPTLEKAVADWQGRSRTIWTPGEVKEEVNNG